MGVRSKFRPSKKAPCIGCGRLPGRLQKGSPKKPPKCPRCPGLDVASTMLAEALPVTILAFDVGAASGWAVARGCPGHERMAEVLGFGEFDPWGLEPDRVCQMAVRDHGAVACVMELPTMSGSNGRRGQRPMSPAVHFGMGRPGGILERCWRLASERPNGTRDAWIPATTWRGGILPGPQRSTEEWKRDARAHVLAEHLDIQAAALGNESPDAICLAEYALRSLELVDLLGQRALAAAGWQPPPGRWVDGRFMPATIAGER